MSKVSDPDYECKMILFWLKEHGSITAKDAKNLCGCKDLRSQIRRLKKLGIPISTTINEKKTRTANHFRFATYRLEA